MKPETNDPLQPQSPMPSPEHRWRFSLVAIALGLGFAMVILASQWSNETKPPVASPAPKTATQSMQCTRDQVASLANPAGPRGGCCGGLPTSTHAAKDGCAVQSPSPDLASEDAKVKRSGVPNE